MFKIPVVPLVLAALAATSPDILGTSALDVSDHAATICIFLSLSQLYGRTTPSQASILCHTVAILVVALAGHLAEALASLLLSLGSGIFSKQDVM